ncbi:50S ribosomal protein L13 [Clavibacter michiganensis subsp. michiganensis]|uniref:50S ribosomal protein L13 n=1 Tax=Clavibacter michiganensis subsp. michiganensis TaxID=33013 RepID=A0A251XLN0_CLAMM|nr:50S ribosomal protein L13 [Clavibacter michiganensis subsp. michiganensis]OUE03958.1 50S ribosomal protein L13 [Clavibacter michiganensis subsp. michiganensis]
MRSRQNAHGAGSTTISPRKEGSQINDAHLFPKASEVQHDWVVIDATDIVLGRLASHAAALLRGKHKATFAPTWTWATS